MSVREYFEKNKPVGFAVVAAIFLLAFFLLLRGTRSPDLFGGAKWMYDLNSQTLVSASVNSVAPADLGGGTFSYEGMSASGAAVDVFVFTCDDPTAIREGMSVDALSEVGAKIGFLARFSDQDAEALRDPSKAGLGGDPVRLLSVIDKLEWVPESSELGIRIQDDARFGCPDGSVSVQTKPI